MTRQAGEGAGASASVGGASREGAAATVSSNVVDFMAVAARRRARPVAGAGTSGAAGAADACDASSCAGAEAIVVLPERFLRLVSGGPREPQAPAGERAMRVPW